MRTINPSSLLRLQDVQPCPLTSTHHTHLFGVQRTILHNNAPHTRHTLVVTATAATDAPKKSAPKKKRDHPEIPNMPMVSNSVCSCTKRMGIQVVPYTHALCVQLAVASNNTLCITLYIILCTAQGISADSQGLLHSRWHWPSHR